MDIKKFVKQRYKGEGRTRVPDKDEAGSKLIEQAIELGWSVSLPEWADGVNDIGDAVTKYGRLYTLYSIVNNAESNELKIRLRSKKWLSGLKD